MNETMQTILTRRSTRKFKVQEIPQTDLDQILKAALHAPSGMGKQTWQFTVVKNRKKVQRLAEAAGKILSRENYDMYQPEILIIPSNQRDNPHGKEDNACAMENIFFWPLILLGLALCGSISFRESAMSLPFVKF